MKKETDNSYVSEKVHLRQQTIDLFDKNEINILDAFTGDQLLWSKVIDKNPNKKLSFLRIDKKTDKPGSYLQGDNVRFMKSIDLNKFDIIDLDAYGSPFNQLEVCFSKKYKGIIHCTFIQVGFGNLNKNMLINIGFNSLMIGKCQTLFAKKGIDLFLQYLYENGVKEVTGYFFGRKNYLWFKK